MLCKQALLLTGALVATLSASAQVKKDIVNAQGAEAPCVGIGPIGGPVAKKCVEEFEQAGFLRTNEVGVSGLTVGTSDKDDGVIMKVDPDSPAAKAGIAVGDTILTINERSAAWTPGEVATQMAFGKKDEPVQITVRREGAPVNLDLVRSAQGVPHAPKAPGFFYSLKPLINWEGQIVPCLGAGPLAPAAIEFCYKRFMPFGYVKVSELGATGFHVDPKPADKAVIDAVDPNSPAAKAGVRVGDEIIAVGGKPLSAGVGEAINEHLFGKAGDQRTLTVHTAQGDKTVTLTLAAEAQK
jgi:C-terminal processing protease CtpA/Prc